MTKLEEVEHLLRRSRGFYETAVMQIGRGFHDLAVFSLEQSLQLFLKASLLKLGVDFPRTHSVRRLLKLIHEIAGNDRIKEILERFSMELGVLEDAYIMSRYVARDYTYEEVERLKKVVKEVMRVVGEVIG
ncbi:MAG: HEPN domain-containing protein [Desulfurococcales archaeon]|nr:HEPN domain-containing protein [Desulfurococcales archaeon]